MCRTQRFARIAHKVALEEHDAKCAYYLGAVVTKGNKIIGKGPSLSKSDPKNPKYKFPKETSRTHLCAEVKACLTAMNNIKTNTLKGCTVYVVRASRVSSDYKIAKPCSFCQRFMAEVGIQTVYYSNLEGNIEKMTLSC